MLTRDFVGGVASIAIGTVYLYFAYQLRISALDDSMGPGGLPRVYGWLLVGLGAVLTIQAIVSRRMAMASDATGGRDEWDGQGRKILHAAGLLAIGTGYVLVIETLGYLLSVAVLLLVTTLYLGAGNKGRALAVAVLGAVFLWVMFVIVLGVRMPSGVLASLGL
ncbi:tripartite tricarboxylate transporter TctB family protein [Mycoplana rhizolycopersici]|uniref:Tripartite tricarboxylate transporter TctB family protein n=1 Tax=Mycoplana rhizolycopersici TaxID=2746702 RepID=A0ABX2QEN8_9HYPH|nr:tripartite tricarboxylate transporter TctB family protein [Rhizobium rhizolycopersici]NVP55399.1 tripartite tricarboxylate transporter TctB family protein [Rhizobium rhizolycopersici]